MVERARSERTELAQSEVVDLARGAVASQDEIVSSMRALLRVVAHSYVRMPADADGCSRALAGLIRNVSWLRGLNVTGLDGRIKCASDAPALGLNVSDRPYFQAALRTKDFVLSDYLVGEVYQVPGLIATYPVSKEGGALDGAVLASINLQWISNLAAIAARHADTAVDLIEAPAFIAASADQAKLIGKNFADRPFVRQMLTNDNGTITTVGFDGRRRILAYVRLPWTRARLAVGLDEAVVHSGIDREISLEYVQLGLFGILRPIHSLVRMATRLGRGDLQVRATDEPWLAEFAPLAAAFDDMARKLAAREQELQIANEHLARQAFRRRLPAAADLPFGRFSFSGGAQIMPSSFMPSGSAK
jgi:hypothetical protein